MPVLFSRRSRMRGGRGFGRGTGRAPWSGGSWSGRRRVGSTMYFRRRPTSVLAGGGPSTSGPPLRSGTISGTSRPVIPRASTSYPTLVPGPRSNVRELKFMDSTDTFLLTSGTAGPGGGIVTSLNDGIVAGSGLNAREGQNTRFMGFRLRGSFRTNGATTEWCQPSILIVYDKQPEAAIPPITDMFDPDLATGMVTSWSLPKFGTRDRYKILYWKTKNLAPELTAGSTQYLLAEQYRPFSFDFNCNLPVTYRAPNTVGPGQIGIGNTYIVFLNFGNSAASVEWYCRYLFCDVD